MILEERNPHEDAMRRIIEIYESDLPSKKTIVDTPEDKAVINHVASCSDKCSVLSSVIIFGDEYAVVRRWPEWPENYVPSRIELAKQLIG